MFSKLSAVATSMVITIFWDTSNFTSFNEEKYYVLFCIVSVFYYVSFLSSFDTSNFVIC